MKAKMREGWFLVRQHMYIAALLFIYQLIWGYFIYRLVQSAVVPLLLRYPTGDVGELSTLYSKWKASSACLVRRSSATCGFWVA